MGKTYIIAEMSANHNQHLDIALETIRAAKKAGADAVKIQTYTADTLTIDCDKPDFRLGKGLWNGETFYSLYKKAHTPWEWHEEIFRVAREEGITCFSTPFDKTAVDFLEKLGNPIYKIASFEITDIPLPIEDANLMTIPDMKKRFGVKVGLSDHTEGSVVPMTAVALGAEVVEKHFIIDRSIGGPDAAFSMTAEEFKNMVDNVRNVEKALGCVNYPTDPTKIKGREFSRSLYIAEDVKAGDVVTEQNVRSVRPGYGLHPKYLSDVLGKKFVKDCQMGERFEMRMIIG